MSVFWPPANELRTRRAEAAAYRLRQQLDGAPNQSLARANAACHNVYAPPGLAHLGDAPKLERGDPMSTPEDPNRSIAPSSAGSNLLDAIRDDGCDLDAVRRLIPLCTREETTEALCKSAEGGHLDAVRLLIPVSDPRACNSYPLRWAARCGQLDVVAELLPLSDPTAEDCDALRGAARSGELDVVRVLVPVSDPKAYSRALFDAAVGGHANVIRELLPLSDPGDVFDSLLSIIDQGSSGRSYGKALSGVNALTPHVGDEVLEAVLRRVPKALLPQLPHLSSWRQSKLLGATVPDAPKRPRGRRSP